MFKKEIHKSLKRLQCMHLALQKYNLDVQYKKGPLVHIADTLSTAYLQMMEGAQDEFCEIQALENVDHEEHIRVEDPKWDIFKEQVTANSDIQGLISVIKQGWPVKKHCLPLVHPYYDERCELIESEGLVFRGEQLVVPTKLALEAVFGVPRRFCIGQE